MNPFSTGFFDSLFGEKVEIEIPGPAGETVKRTVTKKWWDQMIAEGKISRSVRPTDERLKKQATTLVPAANVAAVAAYMPLLKSFPVLSEIKPGDWDFFATVAAVYMARVGMFNLPPDSARDDELSKVIEDQLSAWDAGGVPALEDCLRFTTERYGKLAPAGHESEFEGSDILGVWLVWNVLGRQPETEQECRVVRAAGIMVSPFLKWWDE